MPALPLLPPKDPLVAAVDGALKVKCTECGGPVGEPCETPTGRRLSGALASARYQGQCVGVHRARYAWMTNKRQAMVGRYMVLFAEPDGDYRPGVVIHGYQDSRLPSVIVPIRVEGSDEHLNVRTIPYNDVCLIDFTGEFSGAYA